MKKSIKSMGVFQQYFFLLTQQILVWLLFLLISTLSAEELVITNFTGFRQEQSNMVLEGDVMYSYWQTFTNGEADSYYGFNFAGEDANVQAEVKNQLAKRGISSVLLNTAQKKEDGFIGAALSFSSVLQQYLLPLPDAFVESEAGYTGDFALELLVRPSVMSREMAFYTVENYVHKLAEKGHKESIVLGASGGIPFVQMENFFHFRNSVISFHLQGNKALSLGQWTHLKVTFNRENGLLQFWQNGIVVDYTYTIKTGDREGAIHLPALKSNLPARAELGRHFIGEIDEINISTKAEAPSRISRVKPLAADDMSFVSTFSSKVFRLQPYSKITSLQLLDSKWDAGNVFVTVCYAKKYFVTSVKNITSSGDFLQKCQPLLFDQTIAQEEEALYYQFHLSIKSLDRKKVVGFRGFRLNYDVNKPPFAPQLVRAEALSDGNFLLVWQRSGEEDILGYTVYYSKTPFTQLNGNEKQVSILLDELIVDNKTKELNLQYHYMFLRLQPNGNLSVDTGESADVNGSENIMESLDNQGMYYFSIRSYDRIEPVDMRLKKFIRDDQKEIKRFSPPSNIVSSYMRF